MGLSSLGYSESDDDGSFLMIEPARVPPVYDPPELNPERVLEDPEEEEEPPPNYEAWILNQPQKFFLQVSMIVPAISPTSSDRGEYTVEISGSVLAMSRITDYPGDDSQFWMGMRFASFAGSGIHLAGAGRYGLLAFGPAFAYFSKRSLPETIAEPRHAAGLAENITKGGPNLFWQGSWIVVLGPSVFRNFGTKDSSYSGRGLDFEDKPGIIFEGIGGFAEIIYAQVFWESVGIHYGVGVQQAPGRNFGWFSIGMAGWY